MSVATLSLISVIVFVIGGGRHVALLAVSLALLCFVFLSASAFYGGSRHDSVDGDYARLPDHNRVVTYEISADRISCQSEVTSVAYVWRSIRVYRTPEGFLLYLEDRQMLWLPVHGFQDSKDIGRLAQIAKSHAKEYNNVRES